MPAAFRPHQLPAIQQAERGCLETSAAELPDRLAMIRAVVIPSGTGTAHIPLVG